MGRFRYLALTFATFMFFIPSVLGVSCDYEERAQLNSEVANVTVNYEILEKVLDESEYTPSDGFSYEDVQGEITEDYIQVNVLNITENMYIVVESTEEDSEQQTYGYTSGNTISFISSNLNEVITYTIQVYASSETGCEGTLLRTLYVTTPKYNVYSSQSICEELTDFEYCQTYTTKDDIDYYEFVKLATAEAEKLNEEEEEEANKAWYEKVGDFIVEHKAWFIGGGITLVVIAGATATVIIIRRRRSII